MKRMHLIILAMLIALALPQGAHAVEVKRVVSPGGIEAWLVEDHLNPVISMRIAFQGGAALDPQGKDGLANLASGTMDEGAGDLDSQAFQGILADRSIDLKFDAGLDTFSANLRFLTSDTDQAFDLLRLALTEPRFDDEPVGRIKSQIVAMLKSDSEDPGKIAFDALFLSFFPDHGYGRNADGTQEGIKAITKDDLKTFVKTRLAKSNVKIGVVGDIDAASLGPLLDKTFQALPAAPSVALNDDVPVKAKGRLKVVDRDIVQSTIAFGHAGPKRDDKDFYAALVVNHILGGGSFTSRLYDQVREKRGLAYSVGTGLYPLDKAGVIAGSAGTENGRVKDTIAIVREEWRKMAQGDITQAEVDAAKTYLTGAFPLNFTSTGKIASVLVAMQLDDLGLDYLDRRNAYIAAVTLDDVKRVAAKYLDPAKLDIVVVGRPDGVVAKP